MQEKVKKSLGDFKNNWRSWRESNNPEAIIKGPFGHWRRAFFLLALFCLLFAFTPWIFEAPPVEKEADPKEIFNAGRVGEPVPWGSTIFFYPRFEKSPERAEEIFRGAITLPLESNSTRPLSPLPKAAIAGFEGEELTRADVWRLARAEKRLAKDKSTNRGLNYLVARRWIEENWIEKEARLQGVEISDEQIKRLINNHPRATKTLREAGFLPEDITRRAKALVLAAAIRSLIPKDNLAQFESEWVQRWSQKTNCSIDLPLCG